MKFISLKNNVKSKGISFKKLIDFDGKPVSIRVVSAYFDVPSIRHILEYLSKDGHATAHKELIIIVDAISSKYQSNESVRQELSDLNSKIMKHCTAKRSGIYLAKSGPLFHSKGYLVSSTKYGQFIIGSLNLTQKGLCQNEEIMIMGHYLQGSREKASVLAEQFYKYVDDLIENKVPSSNVTRIDRVEVNKVIAARTLREMFISGRLYYEHKEQDPFRFDLKLPDAIRQSTSNISDLLESTTSNSIDIAKLVTSRIGLNLPNIGQGKAMWKKFCVETCYGFWSPNSYYRRENEDCLEDQLMKKRKKRAPYYVALYEFVSKSNEKVFCELEKLTKDIVRKAKKEGYKDIDCWDFVDTESLKDAWDRLLDNLTRKMEDERFKERLFDGVASVVTPDIWDDSQATDAFEESFFESILYSLRKTANETSNWPAYAIGKNISGSNDLTPLKLRNRVDSALKNGFPEALFE